MTKKEVESQCRSFQIASRQLANTLHKLRDSIEKIEQEAKEHGGELAPMEAMRHEKLYQLYNKTYEDIAETLAVFP